MQSYRIIVENTETNTIDYLTSRDYALDIYHQDTQTGESVFIFNLTPDVLTTVDVPENRTKVLLGEHVDLQSSSIISLYRRINGDLTLDTIGETAEPMVMLTGQQGSFPARIQPIQPDEIPSAV